ncbi:MAG: hotdog fold thioesterase [Gammaproteobacteria bacterium]|nr:hotdog fold thioesterase [Gammaproteobacteria bacterium]MDH3411054.1 hotdog fold thioesterase [Gammaproteobacteria bacterium]
MTLLGAELVEAGAGFAVVRAVVGSDHINFNGTCHGGFTFALADMAFGIASNSHGVLAAGIDAHVSYLAAAYEGDALTANAREVSRTRRVGTYAIDVARADGRPVARFTGTVVVSDKKTM